MNIAEIRKLSDEQIIKAIEDNREGMYKLRFQFASGELKDPNVMRRNKRELARLKTVLHERHLAAQHVAGEGK